jgi:probable F420-dependent oxidoreductase
MKVRIGIGAGGTSGGGGDLPAIADAIVAHRFDSLWLPEILTVPGYDPLVGLAWAAARQPALKVGTTMLLPGRNLARLAKQVASLDALSGGRFLLTFVPGIPRGGERDAVGPPPRERGALMDEALPVLRRLWAGETVTHQGPAGNLDAVSIDPRPVQDPFDVWLGGSLPAALQRCGRLGDGWLPAFCTPDEARDGRAVIERVAAEAGRTISPEHFGVSLGYSVDPLPDALADALRGRAKGRPLADVVPEGRRALRALLQDFVEAGFSKFVVRPLLAVTDWHRELGQLADAVGDLQS